MENIILRAMRTFDESVCAPEYARNQLAIEIIFPEPPVFINELAVRVYSEDYQLIGADVYSPSSRKLLERYVLLCCRIHSGTKTCIIFSYFRTDFPNGLFLCLPRLLTRFGKKRSWMNWNHIPIRSFLSSASARPTGGKTCTPNSSTFLQPKK